MDLSGPAQRGIAAKVIEYGFMLEPIAKGYYEEHQKTGCMCELCKQFELAYASIGHAGIGHVIIPKGAIPVDSKDLPEDTLGWERWRKANGTK